METLLALLLGAFVVALIMGVAILVISFLAFICELWRQK